MKKRISVYIDEGIWELAKSEARRLSVEVSADISASEVVEDAIKAFIGKEPKKPKREFITKPLDVEIPLEKKEKIGVKTEAQVIAEGQAKLDAIRKDRDIKKDKIEGRKMGERVESLTGFSGPLTKAHQTRKKGK